MDGVQLWVYIILLLRYKVFRFVVFYFYTIFFFGSDLKISDSFLTKVKNLNLINDIYGLFQALQALKCGMNGLEQFI